MESDKVLHFFKELDILASAFKYYANHPNQELVTLQDMYVNGFMDANQLKAHARDVRDFKQSLAENKFERLQNFNRLFATTYYRRLLVTFFRESYEYIDFARLDKNTEWLKLKQDILNNSNATSSEKATLLNVETERLVKTICNFLTHENQNKFVVTDKIDYDENMKYSKSKRVDNMKKLLYEDFSTKIKFHSYRLQKTFDINLNNDLISRILNLVGTNINNQIEIDMSSGIMNVSNWIDFVANNGVKFNSQNNVINYTFDRYELDTIKYLDNYLKTNAPKIDFNNNIVKMFEIGYCLSSVNNTYVRTFYTCKNLSTFSTIAQSMQILLQCMQANANEVKKRDYDGAFLQPILNESIMHNLKANINMIHKTKDGKTAIDMSALGGVVNYEPKHMYTEILLTQMLNVLEFFDSQQSEKQEVWQTLGNKSACAQIASSVGQSDNLLFIKTIRNSIGHARYIKDDKTIHFYDGEKDNVQYKFSLLIEDLEKLKVVSMQYLEDYIQNYNLQNTQTI